MTLSREEIAVRLAASLLTGYASRGPVAVDRNRLACDAIHYADGLLLALPPTPAPVAPPAGKYEPRPGDVVDLWKRDGEDPAFVRVVTSPHSYALLSKRTGEPVFDATYTFDEARELGGRDIRYLRDSTDAEKRAAGLAVPPPAPMPAPDAPPYRGADCLNMIGAVVDYFGQSFIVTSHGKSQLLGFPDALASGHVTPSAITFLRWATDEERKQHRIPTPAPEVLTPDVPEGSTIAQLAAEQRASMGLTASMGSTQHFTHAATPAPEAKRPTHVRVTREIPSWSGGDRIEVGTVFPVERWEGAKGGYPFVKPAGRGGFILHPREWEPCDPPAPCPPPVAGRGEKDEAVRGLVAFAARVSDTLRLDGTKRNADLVTEAGRLVALAREAGLCEGGSK